MSTIKKRLFFHKNLPKNPNFWMGLKQNISKSKFKGRFFLRRVSQTALHKSLVNGITNLDSRFNRLLFCFMRKFHPDANIDQQNSPSSRLASQLLAYSASGNGFSRSYANPNTVDPNTPTMPINYIHLCNSNTINEEEDSTRFNSHDFNNNTTNNNANDNKIAHLFLNNMSLTNFEPIPPSEHIHTRLQLQQQQQQQQQHQEVVNINGNNDSLKNLHMIHEQNEIAMHSSTSSSICSSESTTPRLNRSFIMLDRRPSLETSDNDEIGRQINKNNTSLRKKSMQMMFVPHINTNNHKQHQHAFNQLMTNNVLNAAAVLPLNQYFSMPTSDNGEVLHHQHPFEADMYRIKSENECHSSSSSSGSGSSGNSHAKTSAYVNLSRKNNENSLINFSEKESEAILN